MPDRPDEFSLIERYFAPLAGEGSFGLKDDAALLAVPEDRQLVVTTDAIAEGVHFLPGTEASLIARRAIRVNLSDLAAKGATPFALMLSLGLGGDWDRKWIESFSEGFESDCSKYELTLCGGDTFSAGNNTVISITAFGHVAPGGYVSRLGASSGDRLYVTGTIGDATAGLAVARADRDGLNEDHAWLTNRYQLPQPRTEIAGIVSRHASAAMDISDGFIGDLGKLCAACEVSITVSADAIPISEAARNALETLDGLSLKKLLTGGDDYELMIAVPAASVKAFEKECAALPFAVTMLDEFEKGHGEVAIMDNGEALSFNRKAWVHFRGGS